MLEQAGGREDQGQTAGPNLSLSGPTRHLDHTAGNTDWREGMESNWDQNPQQPGKYTRIVRSTGTLGQPHWRMVRWLVGGGWWVVTARLTNTWHQMRLV